MSGKRGLIYLLYHSFKRHAIDYIKISEEFNWKVLLFTKMGIDVYNFWKEALPGRALTCRQIIAIIYPINFTGKDMHEKQIGEMV